MKKIPGDAGEAEAVEPIDWHEAAERLRSHNRRVLFEALNDIDHLTAAERRLVAHIANSADTEVFLQLLEKARQAALDHGGSE